MVLAQVVHHALQAINLRFGIERLHQPPSTLGPIKTCRGCGREEEGGQEGLVVRKPTVQYLVSGLLQRLPRLLQLIVLRRLIKVWQVGALSLIPSRMEIPLAAQPRRLRYTGQHPLLFPHVSRAVRLSAKHGYKTASSGEQQAVKGRGGQREGRGAHILAGRQRLLRVRA